MGMIVKNMINIRRSDKGSTFTPIKKVINSAISHIKIGAYIFSAALPSKIFLTLTVVVYKDYPPFFIHAIPHQTASIPAYLNLCSSDPTTF